MTAKGRGPRAKPDQHAELIEDLRRTFAWRGSRRDTTYAADLAGWWADADVLQRLGPALAGLFLDERHDVVIGPQSRGMLLGALVAAHLGVGLVELRKNPWPATDHDRWLMARTPPDYRNRNLRLGARRDHLRSGQRVLVVEDWIATGGQVLGARDIVEQAGASWGGVAVIVDDLHDSRLRRDLGVRALLRLRDL